MSWMECAMCGLQGEKREDDVWNTKKAIEEFLTLTPECKNEATVEVCDDCFKVYREWLSKQTDEDKRRMRGNIQ